MKFTLLSTFNGKNKDLVINKKVCDVTEFVILSESGYYKGWIGSTENEYFSVAFVKGVLSISLEEREMCIGWKIINIAMISHLHKLITSRKRSLKYITDLVKSYNLKDCENDTKEVKFSDIMKILQWKFKSRKVKVDEHFLNPY